MSPGFSPDKCPLVAISLSIDVSCSCVWTKAPRNGLLFRPFSVYWRAYSRAACSSFGIVMVQTILSASRTTVSRHLLPDRVHRVPIRYPLRVRRSSGAPEYLEWWCTASEPCQQRHRSRDRRLQADADLARRRAGRGIIVTRAAARRLLLIQRRPLLQRNDFDRAAVPARRARPAQPGRGRHRLHAQGLAGVHSVPPMGAFA